MSRPTAWPANGAPVPVHPAASTGAPSARLFYVYGFAAAPRAWQPPSLPGAGVEEDAPVEWVRHGGIAAIVTRVPAEIYEEGPLAERVQDASWLLPRAERHNRVLAGVLEHASPIPCRFGCLFRDEAGLLRAIDASRDALRRALRRLRGREEWAVKAGVAGDDSEGASQTPAGASRGRADASRGTGASCGAAADGSAAAMPGTAYLLGRIEDTERRRTRSATARGRAESILAAAARRSEEVAPLPIRDLPEARAGDLFLNLACLVRRDRVRLFRAGMARLAAREEEHHVTLRWSGPFPPYNFVGPLSDPREDRRSGGHSLGAEPDREPTPDR